MVYTGTADTRIRYSILEYLLEYSQVEELLELFIAVVDAELLKAVRLEVL